MATSEANDPLVRRWPTIRTCCVLDPFCRAAWWHDVDATIDSWKSFYDFEIAYIARDERAILARLRAVVPPPTRAGRRDFATYRWWRRSGSSTPAHRGSTRTRTGCGRRRRRRGGWTRRRTRPDGGQTMSGAGTSIPARPPRGPPASAPTAGGGAPPSIWRSGRSARVAPRRRLGLRLRAGPGAASTRLEGCRRLDRGQQGTAAPGGGAAAPGGGAAPGRRTSAADLRGPAGPSVGAALVRGPGPVAGRDPGRDQAAVPGTRQAAPPGRGRRCGAVRHGQKRV